MTSNVTVINKQKDHEIVRIKYDENRYLILYVYKNMTIVLNYNEKEASHVCCLGKDIIEGIIGGDNLLASSMINFVNNTNGFTPSYDMYVTSANVLKIVEEYKEDNLIYYTGKRVELDKNTNTYTFKFSDGKVMSISLDTMIQLLLTKELVYLYSDERIVIKLKLNEESKSITYKYKNQNLTDKDDTTYVIKLQDINLDNIDTYILLNNIKSMDKTVNLMWFSSHVFKINFISTEDFSCNISANIGDAIDLFINKNKSSKITGKLEILDTITNKYRSTEINCDIAYRAYYNNLNVEILLDGFNPFIYTIHRKTDLRTMFKNAILDALSEGQE